MLENAINGVPQVLQMKINVPYTYCIDEKYITCLECVRTPKWHNDYSVAISNQNNAAFQLSYVA